MWPEAGDRPSTSALGLLLRSELRARWRAWCLLGALLGLSAGVPMAAAQGARRTASVFDRFAVHAQAFDLRVQSGDAAQHEAIERSPLVESVGRIAGLPLVFPVIDGKLPWLRAHDAAVLAYDDRMGSEVDRPHIIEGRAPQRGRHEVLVNDAWAERLDTEVGDQLVLAAVDDHRFQPYGPEGLSPQYERDPSIAVHVKVTVVGRAVLSIAELGEDDSGRAASLVVDAMTMTELVDRSPNGTAAEVADAIVELSIRTRGVAARAALLEELGGLAKEPVLSVASTEIEQKAAKAAAPYVTGLWIFAVAAVVASVAVVGPALVRQGVADAAADERLVQLGAGSRLLAAAAAGRAACIGVPALAAAVALTVGASPLFPIGPMATSEAERGMAADLPVLAVGVVATLLCAVATTVVAARHGRSVAAAPTGRVSGPDRLARRLSLAAGLGLRRAFPGPGASRVLMRASALALVVAVGATSGVTVFLAGLDRLAEDPNRYGWRADVVVTTDQGWGRFEDAGMSRLIGSVEGVESWTFVDFDVLALADGRVLPAIGLGQGQGTVDGVTVTSGRAPSSEDEVVVGSSTMRELGVGVGDTLEAADGAPLRIVGRAVFSGMGKAGTSRAELGDGIAFLSGNQAAPTSRDPAHSNAALVELNGAADLEALRRAVPGFRLTTPTPPGVLRAWPQLRTMLHVALLLLGVHAAATLHHAISLSARTQHGDTAVLRALGMRVRGIRTIGLWQAASILTLAVTVGATIGVLGGARAWAGFTERLGVASPVGLSGADLALPFVYLAAATVASTWLAVFATSSPSRAGVFGQGLGSE